MSVPSPHGHPCLGLTVYTPVTNNMAQQETKVLKVQEKISAKIVSVLSRGKAFIVFLEDYAEPVILAKRIAADDGYIHRTQLVGVIADVTPTAKTNGNQPSYLAAIELPLANMSTNPLITSRQKIADRYAMASLYATEAVADEA